MRVGSIGPTDGEPVEFSSAFAPDAVDRTARYDYAEHTGADGVTRLEQLARRPTGVDFPMTLVPADGAAPPSDRLARLEALAGQVCTLILGPRVLGRFVLTEVRVRYRDAAARQLTVDVRLLEYDGSQ